MILGIAAEATFDTRKWTARAQRDAIRSELAATGVDVDAAPKPPVAVHPTE